MPVTAEQFAAQLKAFDDRRKVVQALRRALVRASKPALRKVRKHARDILPRAGGLNRLIASSSMTFRIGYTSRTAGVKLRGAKKSLKGRSDLVRIDHGTVRHPSWGRRGLSQWHTQPVPSGWWSDPLAADADWQQACDAEVDRALEELRH